jgi:D-sedoheptulose 7-phosphate isomerase
MKMFIYRFFQEDIEVKEKSRELLADKIIELADILDKSFQRGNRVFVFGNGGCAGIAQQMAAAFIGRFKSGKKPKPVLCLSSQASMITSIVNDYGFDQVFKRQLEGLMQEGDVVIGFSTSGNSKNVIEGLKYAREKGAFTVALTGESGGRLMDEADFIIKVPSSQPTHIESTFACISAILCNLID